MDNRCIECVLQENVRSRPENQSSVCGPREAEARNIAFIFKSMNGIINGPSTNSNIFLYIIMVVLLIVP